MLLPIHHDPLRNPLLRRTGGAGDDRLDMRTADCVSALLMFAVVVMLALAVLGIDWRSMGASRDLQVYENTPVMVIPPNPR